MDNAKNEKNNRSTLQHIFNKISELDEKAEITIKKNVVVARFKGREVIAKSSTELGIRIETLLEYVIDKPQIIEKKEIAK